MGHAVGPAWVLASSSDDPYVVSNQLVCAARVPHSYVAVRVVTEDPSSPVPWNRMLTRGVNTAGLAYTYAYVHEPGNERAPHQQWPEVVLAECASVGQAVDLLQRHVGAVLSGNYLLADAAGDAAALEVSRTALRVTRNPDGALVCTNVWTTLEMVVSDRWGAETARNRSARASSLLARPPLDVRAIFDAMRDHSDGGGDADRPYGVSICNHGRQEGTISGEVLEPRHRELWWTYGWPCGQARGYETLERVPWGRFVGFSAAKVRVSGEVTTLDGRITALGVRLIDGVEDRGEAG
jgi:hypothetical protein